MGSSGAPRGRVIPHLRAWRDARFMTQVELAKAVGITATRISGLERGGTAGYATIRALAKALGITPEELVNSEPPKVAA